MKKYLLSFAMLLAFCGFAMASATHAPLSHGKHHHHGHHHHR